MNHYIYKGPVVNLTRVITDKWCGETYAVSEKKAKGNLGYQFKKQFGFSKTTKLFLPSCLIID